MKKSGRWLGLYTSGFVGNLVERFLIWDGGVLEEKKLESKAIE